MPVSANKTSDEFIFRPHHLEGALRALFAAVHIPEASGAEGLMEPEKAIAMTFDAEDFVLDSTPADVKRQIEARYQSDPHFQKVVAFLESRKKESPDTSSLVPHGDAYRILKKAFDANPAATVIFRNAYDIICKDCALYQGRTGRPCMAEFIQSPEGALDMDDAVIEAHSWEYDKPYRVFDVLKWLITESTRRRIAMMSADQFANPVERLQWEQDVKLAASKKSRVPLKVLQ